MNFLFIHSCVFVCISLLGSRLFYHCVGPVDGTQVRFGGKHLYPLSHLIIF